MYLEKINKKIADIKIFFPWYKELIKDKERVESIEELPLMTPKTLEKTYYSNPLVGDYSVYQTSGTSSKIRKKIFYTEKDDERYVSLKSEVYSKFVEGSGVKKALSDMGTGHAASTAKKVFENLGYEGTDISFDLPIDMHVKKLKEFKPDLLYTMPSILDGIINASDDVKEYGIKKIILVGEIATKVWLEKVAKLFGIKITDIMDTYGSIELGTMAYYDHKYNKYIIMDEMVAEGISSQEVDKDYEPLDENESVLVLTSFVREAFPAVRFVTCDVVRNLQVQNIDGRERYTFDGIVKRIGPEIKHGEKISIYDIENVIYKYIDDAIVKVCVKNNRLKILIKSKSLNDELLAKIQDGIETEIYDIGVMIKNNILERIDVINVPEDEDLREDSIKNKKIYYER